jgi:hypothetical protein
MKLGLILKSAFGINSPTTRMSIVEITVWISKIQKAVFKITGKVVIKSGSKASAIAIPNITSAMLLPNNIDPINRVGILFSSDKILPDTRPLFLSTSIFSLLELIKAISEPEKNAEKTRLRIIIRLMLMRMIDFILHAKLSEAM